MVDPSECNYVLYSAINNPVDKSPSVPQYLKAIKNPIELQGFRNAYIRDGAVLVEYLYWIREQLL